MGIKNRNYVDFQNFRYSFNGKEKDNEISGEGNNLDFGARIYDNRLGRFLTIDSYFGKYPYNSTYSYGANSPIRVVDIGGDSLYVLMYYNGSAWGGRNLFHSAALTRASDIINSDGFDSSKDKVVIIGYTDASKIKEHLNKAVADNKDIYGPTVEFDIYSHSGQNDGPNGSEFTDHGDGFQADIKDWASIDFNWSKNGKNRANIFGCNSGKDENSFSAKISRLNNFKGVVVGGQSGSAFASIYVDKRIGLNFDEKENAPKIKGMYTVFFRTYLVGGYRRKEDYLGKMQSVVKPLFFYLNGQKIGSGYATGTKSKH
jgi:RHS repeat-associated protein